MILDLKDKHALVTGGTTGIGRAIVQKLAEAGAHVFVNSESTEDCNTVINELKSQGFRATACPADLGLAGDIDYLIKQIQSDCDKLDMVFLNAGITGGKFKPGDAGYETEANRVFDVNIHSPRRLCDGLLPHMSLTGGGSVVLTSSLSGLRGNKHIGVYSLTKAAIAQLARDMAVKYGPDNIRVNALSPGLIATGWENKVLSNPEKAAHRLKMTPLRRVGTPEEIANVALFLASDLASFVTGHNMVADGGTLITDGN